MENSSEIDTTNRFLVAARQDRIAILKPIVGEISADDALLLAAYLVALAEDNASRKLSEVLEAVQNT